MNSAVNMNTLDEDRFFVASDSDNDEPDDPISQLATSHPALGSLLPVTPDIHETLFDGFFDGEVFDRWIHCKNSWQLHCLGGPGAGKTTFAALAAKRIRTKYAESLGKTTYLAQIFVREGLLENELAFMEDCLKDVYRQLTPLESVTGHAASRTYDKFTEAQRLGKRISLRISLIAKALQLRTVEIRQTGYVFFVADNFDQCSPSLRELLQRELTVLQKKGLNVMLTSRLPRHDNLGEVYCDFHDPEDDDEGLQFYWRCDSCEQHDVCEACYSPDKVCAKCGSDTLWVQQDHFNMSIDTIHRDSLANLIAWDLEREHGNLGLGTNAHKPPLSSFGIAFRKTKPGNAGQEWVQEVVRSVHGSVVQAKLALDRIHSAQSPDSVDFSPYRIPSNLQVLFTEALKTIQQRPASQRELALKSIAAMGKMGDEDSGIPLSRLADLLKERPRTSRSTRVPPRSAEDILDATRGYLRLAPPRYGSDESTIVAFNRQFFRYASEGYNDDLVMAVSLLRISNIPRSYTRVLPRDQKENANSPGPSWKDIIGDLKTFQSPKLSGISGISARTSTPIKNGISGVMRSQTFVEPSDFKLAQPSLDLGLGLKF